MRSIPRFSTCCALTGMLLFVFGCPGSEPLRSFLEERGAPSEVEIGTERPERLDPIVFARILRNAKHHDKQVLWKGSTPATVRFPDGSELKIRISSYGKFFAVERWEGYFTCADGDIRTWADLGLPSYDPEEGATAPVFDVWD